MQLFHIDADKVRVKGNIIELFSIPELLSQLRKVLRIKKGDKISIQFSDKNGTNRYEISVQDWTDKDLNGEIISSQNISFSEKNISMLIAMPNKREKAELIVQKLTEIGVQNIYFWVSEHSVIRQGNEKKSDRLNKISREAVEQSRGIQLPKMNFLKDDNAVKECIKGKDIILANMDGVSYGDISKDLGNNICGIIGPEGGFSKKDLKLFEDAKTVDLGNNVLRMETASIVLGWLLKNM